MAWENNFSYEVRKEYLETDKEMSDKWKSLVKLWKNVGKNLKENLESLPYSEALRRKKLLTAKNIFNVINTAKEKPNFKWHQKLIYNEQDERHEYVIQCFNPSSDYIFRKIKEERGVASMFGESINKYLQPVADKIWALKEALQVSIQPEAKPSDLSYESMKVDIYDDEKEVDPDYPKPTEWWRDPIDQKIKWPSFLVNHEDEISGEKIDSKKVNKENNEEKYWQEMDENGQYLINFSDFED